MTDIKYRLGTKTNRTLWRSEDGGLREEVVGFVDESHAEEILARLNYAEKYETSDDPDFHAIARDTIEEHGEKLLTEGMLGHELGLAYEAGETAGRANDQLTWDAAWNAAIRHAARIARSAGTDDAGIKRLLRHSAEGSTALNVYLSASWKQRERVRVLANNLREKLGASVYDFTDPACRGVPEIPPENFPEQFDPAKGLYRDYITSFEHWKAAVEGNKRAIDACNVVVLMLPCGQDAHADAFYGLGRGKRLIVVGQPREGERTPTHLWAETILHHDEDVITYLRAEP